MSESLFLGAVGGGGGGKGNRAGVPSNEMCQVCRVVKYQFLHYGSFVCNRCRAFFRRMVRRQRKGKRNSTCITTKGDPNTPLPVCDISLFRGACQACRYVTCLQVGMNPDFVLTDDVRSKRYSRNKKGDNLRSHAAAQIILQHDSRHSPQQHYNKKKHTAKLQHKFQHNNSPFRPPIPPPPPPPPITNGPNEAFPSFYNSENNEIVNGYPDLYSVSLSWRIPFYSTARLSTPPNYGGFLPPPPSHLLKTNGSIYYQGPVIDPPWLENQQSNEKRHKMQEPLVEIVDSEPAILPSPPSPPSTPTPPLKVEAPPPPMTTCSSKIQAKSASLINEDDARFMDNFFESDPSFTAGDVMMSTTAVNLDKEEDDLQNLKIMDDELSNFIVRNLDQDLDKIDDFLGNDCLCETKSEFQRQILDLEEERERSLQTPSFMDCSGLPSSSSIESTIQEIGADFDPDFSLPDVLDSSSASFSENNELFVN